MSGRALLLAVCLWLLATCPVHAEERLVAEIGVDPGCGGASRAAALVSALRTREEEILFVDRESRGAEAEPPKWQIQWQAPNDDICDLSIARADASLRIHDVDPRTRFGLQAAAIQILWVLDWDRTRSSGPLPLPLERSVIEALLRLSKAETGLHAALGASLTLDLTSLNSRVGWMLGGQLDLLRWRALDLHLAMIGALPKPESRYAYVGNLRGPDEPSLKVFGAAFGMSWTRRVSDRLFLSIPTRAGFMRAVEDFSGTVFPNQPGQKDVGLWAESLLEIEYHRSYFVVALGAGYRVVGPLASIGPEEFGLSGPILRLRIGANKAR